MSGKIKFNKIITVSGDKSLSIRWVLFSSLANGKSKAKNLLMSEDVLAAINAIKILGIKVVIKKNECEIFGKGINGFKYKKNLKNVEDKINIKVISPNFKLEYGLDQADVENRLEKLIRYSDPEKDKKTLYVWPEGVFSGYSFEEIIYLKEIFFNNFNSS